MCALPEVAPWILALAGGKFLYIALADMVSILCCMFIFWMNAMSTVIVFDSVIA